MITLTLIVGGILAVLAYVFWEEIKDWAEDLLSSALDLGEKLLKATVYLAREGTRYVKGIVATIGGRRGRYRLRQKEEIFPDELESNARDELDQNGRIDVAEYEEED